MSQLLDSRGRPISGSAQLVMSVVLEGTKLNFGANEQIVRQLPLDARKVILENITRLLLGQR